MLGDSGGPSPYSTLIVPLPRSLSNPPTRSRYVSPSTPANVMREVNPLQPAPSSLQAMRSPPQPV